MRITPLVTDTGPIVLPDVRDVIADVAHQWTAEVVARTRSGRDASGKALRPKQDGGRSTLTDSGRMLRSFGPVRIDSDGFTLAPARGRDATVAFVNQHRGRRWVGVTPDQIADARAAVVEALQQGTK